jgi:hypothetical protein
MRMQKLIIYTESCFILSKDKIPIQEHSTLLWVSPYDDYSRDFDNFLTLLLTLLLFIIKCGIIEGEKTQKSEKWKTTTLSFWTP